MIIKMIIQINKQLILESSNNKSKYFENVPCKGIKKKMGFSCAKVTKKSHKDFNKYFIYTHRVRSKAYDEISQIPMSAIKFIDSTG